MTRRRAFSLIEVLMAMLFLALAMLGLLTLNRMSGRGAMDAQYEQLALALAQEPIEVFQNMGFAWVNEIATGRIAPPAEYLLGWRVIRDDPFADVQHPVEASLFQRRIDLAPFTGGGLNAYRIVVTVSPAGQSRVTAWMSRSRVAVEGLILEPPR